MRCAGEHAEGGRTPGGATPVLSTISSSVVCDHRPLTIHQAIANVTFRLGVEQAELAQLVPAAADDVLALRKGIHRQRLAHPTLRVDDLLVVIARKLARLRSAGCILVYLMRPRRAFFGARPSCGS